jgi:hypothetical protein
MSATSVPFLPDEARFDVTGRKDLRDESLFYFSPAFNSFTSKDPLWLATAAPAPPTSTTGQLWPRRG